MSDFNSKLVNIFPSHCNNKVLDVANASYTEEANVPQNRQLSECHHQKFMIFDIDDEYSILVAKHSGKVLTVSGASRAVNATIWQHTYGGYDNQQFKIEKRDDDKYRLIAKHSGLVMDVANASCEERADIRQNIRNEGADNQKFTIKILNGEFRDVNVEALTPVPPSLTKKMHVPSLESHEPGGKTQEQLMEAQIIPYFEVKDSRLSLPEQVEKSPYYKLETYAYWIGQSGSFFGNADNSQPISRNIERTITNSVQSSSTITNNFTCGVSVTGSVDVQIKAVSAGLEVTASVEWQEEVSRSMSSVQEQSRSVSEQFEIPAYSSFQVFNRAIKQKLFRMKDNCTWEQEPMSEWEIVSDITQNSVYTTTAPVPAN